MSFSQVFDCSFHFWALVLWDITHFQKLCYFSNFLFNIDSCNLTDIREIEKNHKIIKSIPLALEARQVKQNYYFSGLYLAWSFLVTVIWSEMGEVPRSGEVCGRKFHHLFPSLSAWISLIIKHLLLCLMHILKHICGLIYILHLKPICSLLSAFTQ